LGAADAREDNLRVALRAASAVGLGRSMEAALRYMLAELLLETGRWDEAEEAIGHNLRLRVAGIPAYFTWVRLPWRDVQAAAGMTPSR